MARGQENEKGKVAVAAFSFVVLSEYVVSLFQCYLDGFGVFSFQHFLKGYAAGTPILVDGGWHSGHCPVFEGGVGRNNVRDGLAHRHHHPEDDSDAYKLQQ